MMYGHRMGHGMCIGKPPAGHMRSKSIASGSIRDLKNGNIRQKSWVNPATKLKNPLKRR